MNEDRKQKRARRQAAKDPWLAHLEESRRESEKRAEAEAELNAVLAPAVRFCLPPADVDPEAYYAEAEARLSELGALLAKRGWDRHLPHLQESYPCDDWRAEVKRWSCMADVLALACDPATPDGEIAAELRAGHEDLGDLGETAGEVVEQLKNRDDAERHPRQCPVKVEVADNDPALQAARAEAEARAYWAAAPRDAVQQKEPEPKNADAGRLEPKQGGVKRPTVNDRMKAELAANLELVKGWTAARWAEHLGCGKTAVIESATWNSLALLRRQAQAEKREDRRRKKKPHRK